MHSVGLLTILSLLLGVVLMVAPAATVFAQPMAAMNAAANPTVMDSAGALGTTNCGACAAKAMTSLSCSAMCQTLAALPMIQHAPAEYGLIAWRLALPQTLRSILSAPEPLPPKSPFLA